MNHHCIWPSNKKLRQSWNDSSIDKFLLNQSSSMQSLKQHFKGMKNRNVHKQTEWLKGKKGAEVEIFRLQKGHDRKQLKLAGNACKCMAKTVSFSPTLPYLYLPTFFSFSSPEKFVICHRSNSIPLIRPLFHIPLSLFLLQILGLRSRLKSFPTNIHYQNHYLLYSFPFVPFFFFIFSFFFV